MINVYLKIKIQKEDFLVMIMVYGMKILINVKFLIVLKGIFLILLIKLVYLIYVGKMGNLKIGFLFFYLLFLLYFWFC